ncbi:MAG: hypothetical protein ACMG6H_09130, partial [Acidobacteriota bacterium]
MPFRVRLITVAFRLTGFVVCMTSIAAGATLPLTKTGDGHGNRVRFFARAKSTAPGTPNAVTLFTWNIDDKQLPLLGLAGDRLKPGFDQSLSFPLDQFGFPIFQALSYDDEHGRYVLPAFSREGNGVHFIEFGPTEIKNTFTSTDGANIKLIDNDNLKTIRAADGTKYTFVRYPDGEFRCAGIKDARGAYLSLVYTANGLTLHGVVDSSGRTLTFNYDSVGIASVTQNWMANSEGLSKTWLVGENPTSEPLAEVIATAPAGERRMTASAASFRTNELAATKALPTNAIVRAYTSEMAASDKLLAQIFGGSHSVAAGSGFEPAGLAAAY